MTLMTTETDLDWIMTLSSSDLQSDSDLDSIRNSCDVFANKDLADIKSAHIITN